MPAVLAPCPGSRVSAAASPQRVSRLVGDFPLPSIREPEGASSRTNRGLPLGSGAPHNPIIARWGRGCCREWQVLARPRLMRVRRCVGPERAGDLVLRAEVESTEVSFRRSVRGCGHLDRSCHWRIPQLCRGNNLATILVNVNATPPDRVLGMTRIYPLNHMYLQRHCDAYEACQNARITGLSMGTVQPRLSVS
jgi:hypothetical protein